MVIEYIRYEIDAGRGEGFEQAYAAAQDPLRRSPHFVSCEVTRCIEDPTSYIVRMGWDSVAGHLEGFRGSEQFRAFFAHVRPYVDDIKEMRHYEDVSIARRTV